MKRTGIVLMIIPMQFLAGKVAEMDGHDFGGAIWWSYVITTGLFFSIGREIANA